jgi:two-component system, LytTR family, sensor histidine kinase AlgZ
MGGARWWRQGKGPYYPAAPVMARLCAAVSESPTPPSDAAGSATRPSSLWPTSGVAPLPDAQDAAARHRERVAEGLDLCRATLVLRVVLFAQVAAAIGTLAASTDGADWMQALASTAFPALVATLAWLAAACGAKRALARLKPWARGALLTLGGAMAAYAACVALLPITMAEPTHWRALASAVGGAFIAALVAAWIEARTRAAQPADASARLAELQSRIRPHFLFNALNTAIALVQVDPQRAEDVLVDLAEIFRVALAEVGASVTLAEEVALAQRYLAIEQVRFGARMQVDWEQDPAADAARLPPLVLQPLVENAVRHGVEPSTTGGRIRVRTQARRGMVRVQVSNTVPDRASQPGAGMALNNVRQRMKLMHDMGASLDTWREDGEYHARLTFPL